MRYSIDGILQTKIIEYKLTERERKLLEFIGFVNAGQRTIRVSVDNVSYIWINYPKFRAEYPYLEIPSNEMVGKIVKSLVEKGLVRLYVDRTPKGTFTYVSLTVEYFGLCSSNPENYDHSEQELPAKSHSNLTSIPPEFEDTPPESQFGQSVAEFGQSGDKIRAVCSPNSTQKNQPTKNQPTMNHPTINQPTPNGEIWDTWKAVLSTTPHGLTNQESMSLRNWAEFKAITDRYQIQSTINTVKRIKLSGGDVEACIDASIAGDYKGIANITPKSIQHPNTPKMVDNHDLKDYSSEFVK